jgi:RND superfamily putative drug exporter
VLPVGSISLNETFNSISEEDLVRGETIGVAAALVILLVVLGALVASGLPLLLGIVSIVVATGLAAVWARVSELSFFVTNMISMIGLAVGIDYALFIVERYREERRHGRPKLEAINVAGATASKAVLFSGITGRARVGRPLPDPDHHLPQPRAGAVLVVVVAVAAMLTLIPALLALLGDKVDWPRKRNYDDPARIARQAQLDAETIHGGFWGRITKAVMARPVVALVLSVGLLVALAVPALDLKTGFAGVETLPPSDVRSGFDVLASKEGFDTAGRTQPIIIAMDGTQVDIQAGLDRLNAPWPPTRPATPPVDAPSGTRTTTSRPSTSSYGPTPTRRRPATRWPRCAATSSRRPSWACRPPSTSPANPAFNVDFFAVVDQYTPWVFAFVLALSFLLLTLAFRSVVVPAKAILMNLLSVGAAYGLLVAVFQKGWGNDIFGFMQVPTIEAWLPIFLFCVLFGLSMDYHVFLLSRVREHYDITGNNTESVAVGLQSTAKIITGAALIMVAVFGGFASGRLVMFQQMGFGLGAAVLIDATIIRSILVPSAMALLGDRNWYMPSWLKWLPDLRVEGGGPAGARPDRHRRQHRPHPAPRGRAGGD